MNKRLVKLLMGTSVIASSSFLAVSCRSNAPESKVYSQEVRAAASAPSPLAPQISRFTVLLDRLDKEMKGLSPQDAANLLVAGKARETAFSLQALGRIYETLDPQFSDVRVRFKKLEDGIGEYAKWVELLAKGQSSRAAPEILERAQKKRDVALVEMEKMLTSFNFVPKDPAAKSYHDKLRDFLNSYPWHDAETDRRDMLQYLSRELDMLKNTRWDFTHLEQGESVHEFRRKIRWVPMEVKALNGMIVMKSPSTPCPVAAYANVASEGWGNTKYGALPGSSVEQNPIAVTPCLYLQIAKLVDVIGAVKGDIEEEDNNRKGDVLDTVKPSDQAIVQKILDEIIATDIFSRLKADLVLPGIVSPTDGSTSQKNGVLIQNAQNPEFCLNTQLINSIKVTNVMRCANEKSQLWNVTKLDTVFSRIENPILGFCLNVKASTEGTETRGTSCGINPDQSWKVEQIGAEYTLFESQRAPGMCLSMSEELAGSVTRIKACNPSDKNQLWVVR